jgi:hypothetical protein
MDKTAAIDWIESMLPMPSSFYCQAVVMQVLSTVQLSLKALKLGGGF